jgi:hypothetical protein
MVERKLSSLTCVGGARLLGFTFCGLPVLCDGFEELLPLEPPFWLASSAKIGIADPSRISFEA